MKYYFKKHPLKRECYLFTMHLYRITDVRVSYIILRERECVEVSRRRSSFDKDVELDPDFIS